MLVSMDDPKSKAISEVLGSKTCKKMISYLAEVNEASEKDFADVLKTPINTIEYNLKKLINSGFVQKKQKFFWSKKGKKIAMYELTNKAIVFSPKKSTFDKLKSIIPAFILTFTGTVCVAVYEKVFAFNNAQSYSSMGNIQPEILLTKTVMDSAQSEIVNVNMASSGLMPSTQVIQSIPSQMLPIWVWFLAGALIATTIITLLNWKKL